MASSNEYGEALKGVGPIPPKQGIYEMSETAKATLSTRLAFADGRVFRYAKAGATNLAPGKICKVGALVAQNNKAVAAVVAVGGKTVVLTTSSAITTAAEGFLTINDVDGEGIIYKIRKTAANATTSTSTDVTIYDSIATALTTNSEGTVIYNPYEQVEIVSAQADIIVGVPPITVTAEYYFWLQTWGPCPVWSNNTPAAGYMVCASVSGSVAGSTTTLPWIGTGAGVSNMAGMVIGYQMQLGVDTEYKLVHLMIAP